MGGTLLGGLEPPCGVHSMKGSNGIKVTEHKVAKEVPPEVTAAPVKRPPEVQWHNGHKLMVNHDPITHYRCEQCGIEGRIYLTPFNEKCDKAKETAMNPWDYYGS